MYIHDFQALCPKKHRRNFVYADRAEARIRTLVSRCVHCGGMAEFLVSQYWQEPCEESKFKIGGGAV